MYVGIKQPLPRAAGRAEETFSGPNLTTYIKAPDYSLKITVNKTVNPKKCQPENTIHHVKVLKFVSTKTFMAVFPP